jgi:uncharacterized membrane-anchored protein YitT (DUF2179 family)
MNPLFAIPGVRMVKSLPRQTAASLRLLQLKDIALLTLGLLSACYGLKAFILPAGLVDGGAMGLALLGRLATGVSLSVLVVAINLPFIVMGYRQVGFWFAFKTLLAIVGLALALAFLPVAPVTEDRLLTAVFGGLFLGAGIGLAMRGGGVIDGTEVLAIYLSRHLPASVGDFILIINLVIFGLATLLLPLESVLYSLLTYFAASKAVDFLNTGLEEYMGVNIISAENEQIRVALTEHLGRGVTVYRGKGGYQVHREVDILLCIVTRLEIARLKRLIAEIDPDAFIFTYSINDAVGGRVKKRPFH